MKYWINVVSKDHVVAGMAGGFTQAGHGAAEPLHALHKDDLIFFYSTGTRFRAGERIQAFTAVARVADDEPYQAKASGFQPWRRRIAPLPAEEAPIQPLVGALAFIQDKADWGASLRRGLFEIGAEDAARIADAMKCRF